MALAATQVWATTQSFCSQADIRMSAVTTAAREGANPGIARFDVPSACYALSIPFCVDAHDTTECHLDRGCDKTVFLTASGWNITTLTTGLFRLCSKMDEPRVISLIPAHNRVRDNRQNSLYFVMTHPTRVVRIPIADPD